MLGFVICFMCFYCVKFLSVHHLEIQVVTTMVNLELAIPFIVEILLAGIPR